MTALSFKNDVKSLFSKYLADMANVKLANETGTYTLMLGDYESVKRFAYEIQVAIHGYDYGRDGNLVEGAVPLQKRDAPEGTFVTSAPHAMPPYGRLPQQAINLFDQWVRDGMQP